MSYIGRGLETGSMRQLDDISSSFDGSTTGFTMQINSVNVDQSVVGDVNQLVLSLGGVIQKPGTDFTVSGSTLTFTTAPETGTNFFCIIYGGGGGFATPGDLTVTTSKIVDDAVTAAKVASSGAFAIGATGTANTLGGIPFYRDANDSIYTHDVSGTQSTAEANTSYGVGALDAITTGDSNTAIGNGALSGNTTGANNIAIGKAAINAADAESHNLAIGLNSMSGSINGAEYNVGIGNYTLDALTTGDNNIAIGYNAGTAMTTAEGCTFIGVEAGAATTIGSANVAIGYQALDAVVVERQCVAVGTYALTAHRTTSASVNDTGNTAVGYLAGGAVTTGSTNTLIGYKIFDTDLTTGSNNTAVGSDLVLNSNSNSNSITLGSGIEGNADRFAFGKSGNVVENTFTSNANWAQSSDQRLKTSITDNDLGLDFINELKTKTYKWKASNDLDQSDSQLAKRYNEENQMDTDVLMYGMLAQEVKTAMDKYNHSKFTGWSEDSYGVQNLSREMFIIPLIKAVQELSAKVKALEDA